MTRADTTTTRTRRVVARALSPTTRAWAVVAQGRRASPRVSGVVGPDHGVVGPEHGVVGRVRDGSVVGPDHGVVGWVRDGSVVGPDHGVVGRVRDRSVVGRGRDRGSISLLMVVMGVVLVGALVAGIGLGGTRVARHRAQNAADAGALAGAVWAVDGTPAACAVAGRVVAANDARLVSCAVDGLDVRVTVEVRVADGIPAGTASARAGPVRDVGADEGSG